MFSWVVKVVPQPPEKPGKLGDEEKNNAALEAPTPAKEETKLADKPTEGEVSEENSSQSGVLTWLSHGFTSALPQPVATPKLGRANSEVKEENAASNSKAGEEPGVINWIVQGLGKVVPQPDDKYIKQTDSQEVTEVHDVKDLKDAEPLPQIPVVEVISDEEADADGKAITPRVMEWIKHGFEMVVPQPSPVPSPEPPMKETSAPEPSPAPAPAPAPTVAVAAAPAPAPAPSPAEPPQAAEGTKAGTNVEEETNMVGWIVQGLSRIVPQPVLKPKEESSDVVESREKDVITP